MDMHDKKLTSNGHKLKCKVPTRYKEKGFFHHKDGQTLKQVAQKGCAVSILEDFSRLG